MPSEEVPWGYRLEADNHMYCYLCRWQVPTGNYMDLYHRTLINLHDHIHRNREAFVYRSTEDIIFAVKVKTRNELAQLVYSMGAFAWVGDWDGAGWYRCEWQQPMRWEQTSVRRVRTQKVSEDVLPKMLCYSLMDENG